MSKLEYEKKIMRRKISLSLLVGSLIFLIYIYSTRIHLLHVDNKGDINNYPYVRYALAVFLSIFIFFGFTKKIRIYQTLNLLWLFPVLIILINLIFGSYNTEKLDFFLGKKIKNYEVSQYENRGWKINQIMIKYPNKTDTIYVSENPSWKNKSYQLSDEKQTKIVKSWITGYYYISVK